MQYGSLFARILSHGTDGTLPNYQTANILLFQLSLYSAIPLYILLKLGVPKVHPTFRLVSKVATRMPMPKAPMNKNCSPIFSQPEVRMPRNQGAVSSESKSLCKQQFPNIKFWSGILTFDGRHIPASVFGRLDDTQSR